MDLKKIGLICLVGPQGAEKSTTMHCLKAALTSSKTGNDGGLHCAEMSEIIRSGLQPTERRVGYDHLPAQRIVEIFKDWTRSALPPTTLTLVVAGLPWGEGQLPLLHRFKEFTVVHLQGTHDRTKSAIQKKHQNDSEHYKKRHPNAAELEAKQHIHDYLQFAPCLRMFKEKLCVVDTSENPYMRTRMVIEHLEKQTPSPIAISRARRAIGRLNSSTHPVHEMIQIISARDLRPSEISGASEISA